MDVKKAMNPNELRSLQEAYLEVVEGQQLDEADSLAAMQARREKRLAAQRKREGTTATGRDFGRDDSLSADQQKKRRDAEFKAGIGTKKEDVEYVDEDSRRMSNKQHTQRVRSNIKSFGSNYTPPSNYDPDANRGKGEVLTRKQMEKKRRKALRKEEVSVYDIVLSHLLDEGYADTIESAEGIMINMSEEWRDSIVESKS